MADWQYAKRGGDREAVLDNLRAVLGDDHPALHCHVRSVFRNFGRYLIDFLRMDRLTPRSLHRYVTFEGFDFIREALARRTGVIGLTAHLGNWELAGSAIALQHVPVTAVALDHLHPRVNAFFLERRRRHGIESVSLGHAFRACLRRLRANGMVGLLGDRNFGDHGVAITLFGRRTWLPKGPAVLSFMTGASIVPCFMIRRSGGRFSFLFEAPITPDETADRETEVLRLTTQYARCIERYIRQYPDQWCLFRRFWVEDQRVEDLRAHPGV